MRLAIVGSRGFNDYDLMRSIIPDILISSGQLNHSIVSGGAKGADTLAEMFAQEYMLPITLFYPEWDKYGKSAGMIRNRQIVDYCNGLVAFWDGKSKGTANSIELAKEKGKLIKIIYYLEDKNAS